LRARLGSQFNQPAKQATYQ